MRCVALGEDWWSWKAGLEHEVLRPHHDWEGCDLPIEPSHEGAALGRGHQLRDPYVYQEDGELFLLYSCAGESGIGVARARQPSVEIGSAGP
jgi:hypothetical protein